MSDQRDPLTRMFGIATGWLLNRTPMSVEEVALAAHVDRSYVYAIRDGKRILAGKVVQALDGVLDADGLLVALSNLVRSDEGRRWKRACDRVGPEEASDLRRRVLFQSALVGVAGTGVLGAAGGLEILRGALGSTLAGQDSPDLSVEEWSAQAAEYGHTYLVDPPEMVFSDLTADLLDVHERYDRETDDDDRRELARVIAQFSALMALTLSNLGQVRASRRWWVTAGKAADTSTDVAVRVWVRGQQAIRSLYERRPPQIAINLA